MQAFVLIQTEVGKALLVAEAISVLPGVLVAEDVLGPYDVVVRVEAADTTELPGVVQRIQRVPGITRTLTCQVAAH
ncbi:Lrp/AsnC ligand binding domain-containing protein [Rhodococcus sp. UNC363MFTsu5.1]|uniref:Lrp/AsnC ligand binding domain-containing protein n=1 Tax=Rhodococcus sp. UNC363MFTsu5.1 TaxID=1449069 RepID=UPI00055FB273|nr:Lrp/AsnC ligand binding domain-containing protein [Rhodococcus sp. UNC363MFTsu5.1]